MDEQMVEMKRHIQAQAAQIRTLLEINASLRGNLRKLSRKSVGADKNHGHCSCVARFPTVAFALKGLVHKETFCLSCGGPYASYWDETGENICSECRAILSPVLEKKIPIWGFRWIESIRKREQAVMVPVGARIE